MWSYQTQMLLFLAYSAICCTHTHILTHSYDSISHSPWTFIHWTIFFTTSLPVLLSQPACSFIIKISHDWSLLWNWCFSSVLTIHTWHGSMRNFDNSFPLPYIGNLNLPLIPCWYNGYTYAVGLVDRYGSSLGTTIHRKCSEYSGPFLCMMVLPGFQYTSLGTRSINIWHHIIWSVVFTRDVSPLVVELCYRRSHTQWCIKHWPVN